MFAGDHVLSLGYTFLNVNTNDKGLLRNIPQQWFTLGWVLSLIPGLHVHTIDKGCSGMAGTFGLGAGNYALSLSAGRAMFQELARPRVLLGSTECSTCRLQMEEGSGKTTLHPAQYLALAYDLMPEIAKRLR